MWYLAAKAVMSISSSVSVHIQKFKKIIDPMKSSVKYSSFQVFEYSSIQVFMYSSIQVFKYLCIQVFMDSSIQVFKYLRIQI